MSTPDPRIVQALAVKNGLKFYLLRGTPINTAYTPKNMVQMAGKLLGKGYSGYGKHAMQEALADLEEATARISNQKD